VRASTEKGILDTERFVILWAGGGLMGGLLIGILIGGDAWPRLLAILVCFPAWLLALFQKRITYWSAKRTLRRLGCTCELAAYGGISRIYSNCPYHRLHLEDLDRIIPPERKHTIHLPPTDRIQ